MMTFSKLCFQFVVLCLSIRNNVESNNATSFCISPSGTRTYGSGNCRTGDVVLFGKYVNLGKLYFEFDSISFDFNSKNNLL